MGRTKTKNEIEEFVCRCTFHLFEYDGCRYCNPLNATSHLLEIVENHLSTIMAVSIASTIASSLISGVKKGIKKK